MTKHKPKRQRKAGPNLPKGSARREPPKPSLRKDSSQTARQAKSNPPPYSEAQQESLANHDAGRGNKGKTRATSRSGLNVAARQHRQPLRHRVAQRLANANWTRDRVHLKGPDRRLRSILLSLINPILSIIGLLCLLAIITDRSLGTQSEEDVFTRDANNSITLGLGSPKDFAGVYFSTLPTLRYTQSLSPDDGWHGAVRFEAELDADQRRVNGTFVLVLPEDAVHIRPIPIAYAIYDKGKIGPTRTLRSPLFKVARKDGRQIVEMSFDLKKYRSKDRDLFNEGRVVGVEFDIGSRHYRRAGWGIEEFRLPYLPSWPDIASLQDRSRGGYGPPIDVYTRQRLPNDIKATSVPAGQATNSGGFNELTWTYSSEDGPEMQVIVLTLGSRILRSVMEYIGLVFFLILGAFVGQWVQAKRAIQ
jgi:hypothetical protein